jgi:ethanolamine ammonia-lyase small subunit
MTDETATDVDPWSNLARFTPARIAIGRAGASLPTREVLAFALAHARARDAVLAPFDTVKLAATLRADGHQVIEVESRAVDRAVYLRRPDLGRRLPDPAAVALDAARKGDDLVLVVGDGLSPMAVEAQARPLIAALRPRLEGLRLGPVIIARGARVALGDEIGERLQARAVAVLIGERPGLSAPDGLGVYLTSAPRVGRLDSERNCLSNIRDAGMCADLAAFRLVWLLQAARAGAGTGVALKDESDRLLVDSLPPRSALMPPS